jgi:hypothetical protein
VIEVKSDEWARYNFDEYSALDVKYGDDETLDIYVNMDNLHLRNEVARRRKSDPDLLREWFKYGLVFLALGILFDQRRSTEVEDGPEDRKDHPKVRLPISVDLLQMHPKVWRSP